MRWVFVELFIFTDMIFLPAAPFRRVSLVRRVASLLAMLSLAGPQASQAAGVLLTGTHPAGSAPVPDPVYLQEIGSQVAADHALSCVGVEAGHVWVGSEQGLESVENGRLLPVASVRVPIRRLVNTAEGLFALSPRGWFVLGTNGWARRGEEDLADVTSFRGRVVTLHDQRLHQVMANRLVTLSTNRCAFPVIRLLAHQESLALLSAEGRMTFFNRGNFGGSDAYGFPADQAWDWGDLPSPNTRDLVSVNGSLWMATDRGLAQWRGMSLMTVGSAEGLPAEDVRCLAPGFERDLWIGTSRGAVRYVGGKFHYFGPQRWIPHARVQGIAVSDHTVYIATDGGLGIIRYQPYTLAKKAAFYETQLEAWGQKRLGFTHKLEWDEKGSRLVREASDNDGGYSSDYLAAQSYRWAVTHDPVARREATNTFHALRWLESMTGIPGFPARAVWVKGEEGHKSMGGSGGYPAEWHDVAGGVFEWKGDTSSDEICGHFYSVSLFLELVAEGAEVEQARRHLSRIASHLIDHQWQLVDLDGQPTRWGRWDPEYFKTDEGRFDRGLQALEMLSFMKTASHFTHEKKFEDAYQKLLAMGYADYTLRQRSTFPPEDIAHFEDQLAFWCWWTLLRFETDPDLHALYRRGYERSFETVRVEQNPWYAFLHEALSGEDREREAAVAHLREWPLDLRLWSFDNTHRGDIRTPSGYRVYLGGTKAFSPREREPLRWDAWTMGLRGGEGGRQVIEPGGWLVAYWQARYHGILAGPAALPDGVTTVKPTEVLPGGAAAYSGPPRPAVP